MDRPRRFRGSGGEEEGEGVIDDRDSGRDDGIKCKCGASTFLVDDQGGGLRSYECENPNCSESTMVQFEWDEPEEGPV